MRVYVIGLAAVLSAALTMGQQQGKGGTPAMKLFASSADVQGLIAKAKAQRKDNQPTVSLPILQLAPYNANLEYRASVGPAAVHEKEAEMFYVIDGSATLTTGGKLTSETRNGDNLTGTGIEGGQSRTVSKGDFVIVPENTPHWFGKIDNLIVLMSIHVPRTSAGH